MTQQKTEDFRLRGFLARSYSARRVIFYHPDCTVGPGIVTGSAIEVARGLWRDGARLTAGREFHPAPKMVR